MITFPLRRVVCEGCDLSGKSSLIRKIHKQTKFRWNIHDRSYLSMLIYAQLYGRETFQHREGFWNELSNLNNSILLLMPPWEVIKERFFSRGDEHQDENSLEKVYDLFSSHDWVGSFPNVKMSTTIDNDVEQIVGWLQARENFSLEDISNEVTRYVGAFSSLQNKSDTRLSFMFYDHGGAKVGFEEADPDIYDDSEEGAYYTRIRGELCDRIEREIAGDNEWKAPQKWESTRRFIHADPTCISLIHVTAGDRMLDVRVVLRSSNVATTFHKDLAFIYGLPKEILERFSSTVKKLRVRRVRYRIELNSAHLAR